MCCGFGHRKRQKKKKKKKKKESESKRRKTRSQVYEKKPIVVLLPQSPGEVQKSLSINSKSRKVDLGASV